ncbi:hypothetical protein PSY31_24120, partial [Shigella flexneri]|nr:hypothetical protein [Shigella flexneri]
MLKREDRAEASKRTNIEHSAGLILQKQTDPVTIGNLIENLKVRSRPVVYNQEKNGYTYDQVQ